MRVTRGGPISAAQRQSNRALKKRRCGGQQLATLSSILPTQETHLQPVTLRPTFLTYPPTGG